MPVWLDILSYLAIDDKKRACIFAPAGAADPQVYVAVQRQSPIRFKVIFENQTLSCGVF
jgi:hypothetical protein